MEEIDLRRLYKTAFAVKWYIVLIMIVSIVFGLIYSFLYKIPEFKSTATIVLTQASTDINTGVTNSITTTDITMNKNLVETYSDIIESKTILTQVINNLGLEYTVADLMEDISVRSKDTAILYIDVVNSNAEYCEKVANEVANVFADKVKELYKISNVNILDLASKEETPYNVNHVKDLVIFGMIGVFLSGALVLVVYMLDTTVKQEEDIEEHVGLPVIGIVPLSNEEMEKKVVKGNRAKKEIKLLEDIRIPTSEAFRTLRTNLTFAQKNRNISSILVTSSYSGEGKSYISSNLAIALAKSNKKVLVIDADMRKGRQNSIFRVANSNGLSNALIEINNMTVEKLSSYIKTTSIPNIHIITSGDRPTNPSELVSSSKMAKLLSIVNEIYDFVVIDGTPSILVADSVAISKFVDSVLIVTAYKSTKIDNVQKMKKMFENVGSQITGVIINKYPIEESAYGQKYYYSDNRNERIEKEEEGKIQTVKEVIEESRAKVKTNHIYDALKDDSDYNKTYNSNELTVQNNTTGISQETSSYLQLKMENINQEINAIKNLFIQYMMNNQSISKEEFLEIKHELENIRTIVDSRDTQETREMREEIETIKSITSELVEKQKTNAEKVKEFIEAYRRKNNIN